MSNTASLYYEDQGEQESDQLYMRPEPGSLYVMRRRGPLGSAGQANTAAHFFSRSHGRARWPARERCYSSDSEEEMEVLKTNFRSIVSRAPPSLPASLLRRLTASSETTALGKVRVILRVASNDLPQEEQSKHFHVNKKGRQVTLLDPSIGKGEIDMEDRMIGVAAPKMFAFDGVFSANDSQEDVAAAALSDIISAVTSGNDGCLFCFGHANLGKTWTMLGDDASVEKIGVIPIAIAWLYRSIKAIRQKTDARFSVRVSAVEICGAREVCNDLLSQYAGDRRGAQHRQDSSQLMTSLTELRASNAEKAAFYLDAALNNRTRDETGRESHFVFSLYVYQYKLDKTGKGGLIGGRTKLHLIDFGGCDRTKVSGGAITLSGLGNVILGIFNGVKHLPCRGSVVTSVLQECLTGLTCHATMIAHVSPEPSHYSETLHTVQLASRVHRMRRKKMRRSSETKLSEGARRVGVSSSSEFTTTTDPSSSELSCDTVVYRQQSDGSGTDGEGVPSFRSSSESLLSRSSKRRGGSKILTNGAISPAARKCSSPFLPVIEERMERMPLHGKVPTNKTHEVWIDSNPLCLRPSTTPIADFSQHFKADMVSRWVENQGHDNGFTFLTQFKQDESDCIREHFVETHFQERRIKPPPPPPRISQAENVINVNKPLIQKIDITENDTRKNKENYETQENDIYKENSGFDEGMSCHQHPLRILSEENLSVVSTFVLDSDDLAKLEEAEEQIDPSRFPFFTVPDFTNSNGKNDQYFESRLRDLNEIGTRNNESLTNDDKNVNNETQTQAQARTNNDGEVFNDPRFLYGNYKEMSTFSVFDGRFSNSPNIPGEESEVMTPQKQFLLLSQSLRLPDGSSNPDLFDSDKNENFVTENSYEASVTVIDTELNVASEVTQRKKSELTFAAKLLRLFSSKRNKKEKCKNTIDKRSKSCDRELEENCKKDNKNLQAMRSASCSPLKQRQSEAGTPVASCVSLVPTEWEYSHLQDTLNGNTRLSAVTTDRKSSGYDSLEGENSSVDSSQEVCDGFIQLNSGTLKYAVPNDNKNTDRALDYDDISALKDEIRRYPNILRRAY